MKFPIFTVCIISSLICFSMSLKAQYLDDNQMGHTMREVGNRLHVNVVHLFTGCHLVNNEEVRLLAAAKTYCLLKFTGGGVNTTFGSAQSRENVKNGIRILDGMIVWDAARYWPPEQAQAGIQYPIEHEGRKNCIRVLLKRLDEKTAQSHVFTSAGEWLGSMPIKF